MKKFLAMLLAIMMVLAMVGTAVADDPTTYTITITNTTAGHFYEAYQIFAGDLDSEGKLSNITWGSAVSGTNGAAIINAIVEDTDLQGDFVTSEAGTTPVTYVTSAAELAEKLTDTNIKAVAKIIGSHLGTEKTESNYNSEEKKYTIEGLAAGYYFVKDKDSSLADKDDFYTDFILKVVKNTTATPKGSKPTVDKQVYDETADAEAGATNGWGESADHAINEPFQFKLIATLTKDTNYASYETYKLVFTDTMDDGVTFESIESVKVGTTTLEPEKYTCTATANQAGGSWTLTIDDIIALGAKPATDNVVVEVVYNAHLNEKAKIVKATPSTNSNNNKVYLQYSNNPNADGEGSLGKTPEDTVFVFTYEVDNTKYAESTTGSKLPGAKFVLKYSNGSDVALYKDGTLNAYRPTKEGETPEDAMVSDDDGLFNIVGLDAGTYTLTEIEAPAGYNKCDDINIVISATHAEENATTAKVTLTSNSTTNNKIVDKSGSTLPETGGIGTTILYVIGGMMVLAAVVLLVTKRRAGANN